MACFFFFFFRNRWRFFHSYFLNPSRYFFYIPPKNPSGLPTEILPEITPTFFSRISSSAPFRFSKGVPFGIV